MFNYLYKDLDIAHKYDILPVPSPDYKKHYHDFYEIFFLVKGNVTFTVENEIKKLEENDILLIQPGEHHFVTFLDDSPYERYVLKFQDHMVPQFLKDCLINRSAFYTETENFRELFRKLDIFYDDYNALELQLLFSSIVTELLIKLNHSQFNKKESNNDEDITAIIQYINENIRQPLTAQDLCNQFHFSQSYLYEKFHTHMKTPIMKYIRSKKIIAAYQMITRGEKPTKVAESFGYVDYTTFYRAFISVMGFSPSFKKNKSI